MPSVHAERTLASQAAALLVGILVALALAEVTLRIATPTPRAQIIRGHGLHVVDGVPLWTEGTDRYNRSCVDEHPDRQRILFFGSSITYGSGLRTADVFTTLLERELNARRPAPGFCVLNFAQPAFQFEQKYAVARVEVPRYRPALVMWEDWVEWRDYTVVGHTAYSTSDLAVRPDGAVGLAGVPDRLNRLLLTRSRLYEYLALTFGERRAHAPEVEEAADFVDHRLPAAVDLARSAGARFVMYLAPPLDRPFRATAGDPPEWQRVFLEFARARAIPAFALQRELIDEDYLKLRMDACCHYSAEGHRILAHIMARRVLEQLDAATLRDAAGAPR